MKKSRLFIVSATLLSAAIAYAEIPAGYYSTLEAKSGTSLRDAVKAVCAPSGFTTVSYGPNTWEAFDKTDVRYIDGRKVWRDMYSNNIVYVETGHDGLNIEHSVANSWWGGKSGNVSAYQDLMHLNPSDQAANGAKSDNPMGVVATASFENGLVKVGTPASGYGGGAGKVFEPADEYKGDFARAYLYLFTAYNGISWKSDKQGQYMLSLSASPVEPQEWVAKMLVEWSKQDPVDDKEISRNEEIYKIQHNRNPFIDYPSLAEYLYGDRKSESFSCAGKEVAAVNRPEAPAVEKRWLTGVNTFAGRWWNGEEVRYVFDESEGDLWVSIDGGNYQRYGNRVSISAAGSASDSHKLRAYLEKSVEGYTLKSSVTTLTLTALDPDKADYTTAVWEPVTAQTDIQPDAYYVLLSQNVGHVMGHNLNSVLPSLGFARHSGGNIVELPVGTALISFVPVAATRADAAYTLRISDEFGKSKGFWEKGTGNNLKLNSTTGTKATVAIESDGTATIQFSDGTYLRYNQSQPRFSNYAGNSSANGKVRLYKFKEFPSQLGTGVGEIAAPQDIPVVVDGRNIYPGENGAVYDLNGRRLSGLGLQPGIYVAVNPSGRVKILIK